MAGRVLLMCGSLQRASANRAALDEAASFLRAAGDVEVEEAADLASIPAFNADLEAAPGGAVEQLRTGLGRADSVMIAAPEYAGGLAGALKNALDWIVGSGELYTKPAVVLSAGTSGGEHARRDLIRTLTWQGAHVVGQLGISAPRTRSDADGRFTDPDTIAEIRRLARLATDIPTVSAEERLRLVTEVTAGAGIAPGHISPVT